jgi:hypothetical protein
MTHSIETAKSLHINVKQLAGTITLVSLGRIGWIDTSEPTKIVPPADTRDGRHAHPSDHSDSPKRHSLPAKLDDPIHGPLLDCPRAMRPRAAVVHRLTVFASLNPLVGPTRAEASGRRRLSERPTKFQDSPAQQCST